MFGLVQVKSDYLSYCSSVPSMTFLNVKYLYKNVTLDIYLNFHQNLNEAGKVNKLELITVLQISFVKQ